MAVQTHKIYVDWSETPVYSATIQRTLAVSAGSYSNVADFTSQSGQYYLFIAVKTGNLVAQYVANFDHYLTLGSENNYVYYKVDKVSGDNIDANVEIYCSDEGAKIRLHRIGAGSASTYDVSIQNLVDTTLELTESIGDGTDSYDPEANNCVLTPATISGSHGTNDHNDLLNSGRYPHSIIDAHIDAPSPHSGHALVNHTHSTLDITSFREMSKVYAAEEISLELATDNDIDADIITGRVDLTIQAPELATNNDIDTDIITGIIDLNVRLN